MNATSRYTHPAGNCVPADGSKYCSDPAPMQKESRNRHANASILPAKAKV